MRKYKRFFHIPLNKLPWSLPLKEGKDVPEKLNTQGETTKCSPKQHSPYGQDSGKIDQRLMLEILRIIQQRRNHSSAKRGVSVPMLDMLSAGAGKAGLHQSLSSYEDLDSLYNELAPRLHIRARLSRRGLSLPVVEYGYENYDPERHTINRVNFKRMTVDPGTPFKKKLGKVINFQVPRYHHYISVPCGVGTRSFPDICLLLDTSGSMRDGGYHVSVPWGERSGYHYALLGFYGIMKYLEREGIASSVLWNVINFSDATRASGWKAYNEISQLKKHGLTPQFGGTEIDVEVLREQLSHEYCLTIILSDGEIYNWEKIRAEMQEIIQPHYVCFIQIGHETRVGKDMRDFGAVVLTVRQKEDIADLMVDATKQVRYSF